MTHPGFTVEDPDRELRRVLDRCVSLPLARWERPGPDGRTPVDLVRAVLQTLADLAADGEGRPRRPVPELRAHGLGDQLAVLTRDALAVADDAGRLQVATALAGLRARL